MIEPHTGWRKSTYSSTPGGNCVEVANAGTAFAVRDSKDPAGPTLTFSAADWSTFLASQK